MTQIFDPKLAISFHAVVSAGSVTAGARARGVAQPWMSEQIRKLERHLGCRLLLRTSRQLELTDEGRQFLPYAQAIAEADEAAQAFVSKSRTQRSLTLTIGACQYSAGIPERQRLLHGLLARHPQLNVEVKAGSSVNLVDGLLRGEYDIIIVHLFGVLGRTDVEHMMLAQRVGFMLVPEDDPLAALDHVEPAMLAGRQLFIGPGNDDSKAMNRSLQPLIDAGVERVRCADNERSFLEAQARQHHGLCMYWSPNGKPRSPRNGQRCIPLVNPSLSSPLALVRRANEDVNRPIRWTWDVAADFLAEEPALREPLLA